MSEQNVQKTSKNGRFTKAEKSWILYDWANSVYATNMLAAIFPIYYASVAGDAGDKWWGIGVAIASFFVAITAPFLGSIGDFHGMKKRLFACFAIGGMAFTAITAFAGSWQLMLIGYVLSHIGFSGANVFYDSFLTDVTTRERMDKVSAWGYAMGYLGGSTIPFVISIAVLLATDFSQTAVRASILLTTVWWAVFSIPIFRNVKQTHFVDTPPTQLASAALRNLRHTLGDIVRRKGLLLFLVAYFFYIDGVNTVISLATNYGATLGLGSTGMILALLITQLVAIPCAILFSKLAAKVGSVRMIGAAIAVYFCICSVGFFMGQNVEPYQLEYTALVEQVTASAEFTPGSADERVWQQVADDLKEDGRDALAAKDRPAAFYTLKEDGTPDGVIGDVIARLKDADNTHYAFSDEAARAGALAVIEDTVKPALLAFAADDAKQTAYTEALGLSSLLFWLMAVLVGTVQGGIQALSRAYYGKLIPVHRSNEFFGFYDIFGKFAAVIGPFLYSVFYMLTGRASIGIISLMVLFILGGVILLLGRKQLQQAEKEASLAAEECAAES